MFSNTTRQPPARVRWRTYASRYSSGVGAKSKGRDVAGRFWLSLSITSLRNSVISPSEEKADLGTTTPSELDPRKKRVLPSENLVNSVQGRVTVPHRQLSVNPPSSAPKNRWSGQWTRW